MKYLIKYSLFLLPCILLLWACPAPESVQPNYQPIEIDLEIEVLPKNFMVTKSDTAWIKTSISESAIQNAINGKGDISKVSAVNFVFNLKNLSQSNVLMQNQYYDLFIRKGSLIQKREKDGETNFQMRMSKNDKKYELEMGFLMKKEGIYNFNLNSYSSTQVMNNYTGYFPAGGGVGFSEGKIYVIFKPKFIDKSFNDKFYEQLKLNGLNDKNSLYFKAQL